MIGSDAIVLPPQATDDAKAFLRVDGEADDGLIAGWMRSGAELCERFTGQVTIAREVKEVLPASAAWQRLGRTPVRAISTIQGLPADGEPVALPVDAFAIDIDAQGDGWIRITGPGDIRRVQVSYEAGMAAEWTQVPDALRQGMVRLAAHLHAHRDEAGDMGPPAAVTALWRPWRRLRLQ
ncbi:hypothetical protein SH591_05045 [Sphingomonas sp. LY54]|uniref:head-tail connector protein n=1 Tax=Sphingomonas sp. LY54 TaxID=3095343 RepID=UPI002D782312|nr:hypothetical protein [Sphingomonas sp. LY54]WRP29548.1 hypothetical protein SH591_05045 [Sphingomonas sp. LY54]